MIKENSKFNLKTSFIILMMVLSVISCTSIEREPYKPVVFTEGLPEGLESLEKDLPFTNYRYASLETGTDTLKVFFGTFMQGSDKGNWIAVESQGIPAHFSTVSLEENDSLDLRSKDVEIEFNEERNKFSVRIVEVDSLNIKYAWLKDSVLIKEIDLVTIKKPLRKDLPFPEMNLESVNGELIPSSDFQGQFVVINWWATWCAPCIKEIPGLNEIVDRYRENENVRFIAVTDDPRSRIENFLEETNFQYEMTFANQEVQQLFGNSYPVNIIIDPSGTITFLKKGAGDHTPAEIEASLKQQLLTYTKTKIAQAD